MNRGRTLVTGATGHLGANLVRRLLREGEALRVMVQPGADPRALDGLEVERCVGDVRDANAVAQAVRGCVRVHHCAALVSTIDGDAAHKRDVYDTNVGGTANVLAAARAHDVEKVVVSGSLSAIGYERGRPSHEEMPFNPFERQSPYSWSKHLVEHLCLRAHANGLVVVVATSCSILGPNDFAPSRMGQLLVDFANRRLRAYIPGGFEFTAVADIVEGHVLAMEKGRSGQKYIFSSGFLSVDELLKLFREVTGAPLPVLRLPPALMALAAEVSDRTWFRMFPQRPRRFTPMAVRLLRMERRADHGKATRELGFQPTSLLSAIRDAYDDFVGRGLIPRRRG